MVPAVTILTVATALIGGAVLQRSRAASRWVEPVASAPMLNAARPPLRVSESRPTRGHSGPTVDA